MGSYIDAIICRLGYSGSPFLLHKHSFDDLTTLSVQTAKVLNELSPYAAYMVDGKPFIIFFDEDESADQDQQKARNRKIWNAQIPVVFFAELGLLAYIMVTQLTNKVPALQK